VSGYPPFPLLAPVQKICLRALPPSQGLWRDKFVVSLCYIQLGNKPYRLDPYTLACDLRVLPVSELRREERVWRKGESRSALERAPLARPSLARGNM
jgi:hypothetical protein